MHDSFEDWRTRYDTFFLLRRLGLDTEYYYIVIRHLWEGGRRHGYEEACAGRREHNDNT
jgi:hypothetical protein